jgi:hypothetical protein
MSRPNDTTSCDRITRAENAREAMGLRLAGLNYEQIGRRMGFTRQRAHQLVKEELSRINAERNEAAEQLRTIEAERLDRLQSALWLRAMAGDLHAIDRVLRVMERRAKLLGLDVDLGEFLSRDQAMALVRGLLDAVRYEVDDPDTARRILARVGRVAGNEPVPEVVAETVEPGLAREYGEPYWIAQVDQGSSGVGVDEKIEEGIRVDPG